jgi:hypothetical protein
MIGEGTGSMAGGWAVQSRREREKETNINSKVVDQGSSKTLNLHCHGFIQSSVTPRNMCRV